MDNSGKIYSLLDQASFNDWLTQFFNKKSNELAYSRQNQPKRMEKLVLNLATAQTQGYKVPVPFKSCVVSRIYSTSSGTDKAGSIRILFDQPNLGNLNNAVNLFVNDTLKSETLFTESYLLWSAQADTTIELYFFPDLEISTGTTKTQIVGTVSTIASGVLSPISTSQSATGASFTVSASTVAVAKVYCANGGKFSINGVDVLLSPTWSTMTSANSPRTVGATGGLDSISVPLPLSTSNSAVPTTIGGLNIISADRGATFSNATATNAQTQTFVLKAGDVLLGTPGSGTASYHIEVYTA